MENAGHRTRQPCSRGVAKLYSMKARDELKRPPTSGTRHGNGSGVGGPANGPGWGGAARGSSTSQIKPMQGPGPGRGHFSIAGEEKRERNDRHAEEMRALYYEFAHDPEQPAMVRINAATHLLNRIDGLPTATVVSAEPDELSNMTDAELEAERDEIERKLWISRTLGMTAEELEAEIDKEVQRIRGFVRSVS